MGYRKQLRKINLVLLGAFAFLSVVLFAIGGPKGYSSFIAELYGSPFLRLIATPLICLVLFVFGVYVAVFFHELGHLIASWALRLPVRQFAVGGILTFRKPGAYRSFTFDNYVAAGDENITASQLKIMLACGPLASWLYLASATWFWLAVGSQLSSYASLALLLIVLGAANGAISSVMPMRAGPYSDPQRLMVLQKDPGLELERFRVHGALVSGSGVRSKDLPDEVLELAESRTNNTLIYLLARYGKEMDGGSIEKAGLTIQEAWQKVKECPVRGGDEVEVAYRYAAHVGRFHHDQPEFEEAFAFGQKRAKLFWIACPALLVRESLWGMDTKAKTIAERCVKRTFRVYPKGDFLQDSTLAYFAALAPEFIRPDGSLLNPPPRAK